MKTISTFVLAALCLFAAPALAGEKPLGIITSPDGTERTNATTAAPFVVPIASKLTIVACTAAVTVCVDTSTACVAPGAGANFGTPVAAAERFPTSVDEVQKAFVVIGTDRSSIVRIVGAGAFTCYVMYRNGNE